MARMLVRQRAELMAVSREQVSSLWLLYKSPPAGCPTAERYPLPLPEAQSLQSTCQQAEPHVHTMGVPFLPLPASGGPRCSSAWDPITPVLPLSSHSLLSPIRALSWDLGPPQSTMSSYQPLITSAKTLFPNKVTFQGLSACEPGGDTV